MKEALGTDTPPIVRDLAARGLRTAGC